MVEGWDRWDRLRLEKIPVNRHGVWVLLSYDKRHDTASSAL